MADEPTGDLNRNTGKGIEDLMLRLNKEEGLALIIATRNQSFAKKMSHQLEIIDGQIQRGL